MIKTLGISLSCRLRPRISEFLPNDAAATAGSKCPLWVVVSTHGNNPSAALAREPKSRVLSLAFWQNEPKCVQRRKRARTFLNYKPNAEDTQSAKPGRDQHSTPLNSVEVIQGACLARQISARFSDWKPTIEEAGDIDRVN